MLIKAEAMLRVNKLSGSLVKWIIGCVIILCQDGCSSAPIIDGGDDPSAADGVFLFNPPSEYDSLMVALKPDTNPKSTSFLWFTDLHFDIVNLRRIKAWYSRYQNCFDDMLSTGDQQYLYYTDDYEWWGKEGSNSILQLVGNHDAWISNDMYENGEYEGTIVRSYGSKNVFWILSQKDTYDKFFSPYIDSWNVIQPEAASERGCCYYYKDYEKLRLIVLDCKHYGTIDDQDENKNSLQDKWFKMVLEDAREKNLPVIVASHYPPGYIIPISCSYTYKNTSGKYSDCLNKAANKHVSNFIDKGGEFVCWLAGHVHDDVIGVLEADERQLLIICATANCYRNSRAFRQLGTKTQDSFNCISVDTGHKQVLLVKVGADTNVDNERKRIVKYNYRDFEDESGVLHERGLVCSY